MIFSFATKVNQKQFEISDKVLKLNMCTCCLSNGFNSNTYLVAVVIYDVSGMLYDKWQEV